jgi:hypothetical protein
MTTTEIHPAELASRFINNTNRHVFLTGKAGTGKTTFLRHIIKHTFKNAVIVAPTGVAAINAGGVTIHSLFQLPFGSFVPSPQAVFNDQVKINTPSTLFKGMQLNSTKRKLLQELELLIIDEVSMLRADLLDAIDTVLKSVRRKNHLPFGGVQVLFIGDLLQLPPVVKEDEWRILKQYYKSAFFFEAKALQNNKPMYIELDKIYRQADDTFIGLLNNLRDNKISNSDIEILNKYYRQGYVPAPTDNIIHLTTHNYKAENLNKDSLRKLEGKSYFYRAEIEGDFNEFSYPVDQNLELKKGAQVMFIKNDITGMQRYFNGKIGTIDYLDNEKIEVRFQNDNKTIIIEHHEWENIKYTLNESTNEIEEKTVGTFKQYPIKLGWAITVHKSQGLTFEKAILDIGDAFAPGQVYVALSRLTSLDGLILTSRIRTESLTTDETIKDYSDQKPGNEELQNVFESESIRFFKEYILNSFDFTNLEKQFRFHSESYQKEENRSAKQKFLVWSVEILKEIQEVKTVSDKFLSQLNSIFSQTDYKENLQKRTEAAAGHFLPLLKEISKKIKSQLEVASKEKKIKTYLTELNDLEQMLFKQTQTINKALAMVKSSGENEEFSKEKINTVELNKERVSEEVESIKTILQTKKRSKDKKVAGEKTKKEDTKKISYDAFKSGKSIEEIAKERNMTVGTIETHLSYYAGLGMIDVKTMISEDRMNQIIAMSKTLDTTLYGPIKNSLGDNFTYGEIKLAMSFYLSSKK